MIKLKRRVTIKNGSARLPDLVREACAAVTELRALDTPTARKLTAAAFLRTAMRIAGTSPERLRELREKVFDPISYFAVKAFLRRAVAAIRSPNWPGPARELRRYNFLLTPEALGEIVALDTSTFELVALAVQIATETHPEDFGDCTDLAAHEARILALALRRDELYQRIEQCHSPDDIAFGEFDSHGNTRITFAMTGGAVPLGRHAGQRLVAWALAHENT